MQLITATVTFAAGTAVILSTIPAFANIENFAVAEIYIEPAIANTHVCYVGDNQLATGTSTVNHVVRTIAIPVAGAALDSFRKEAKQNANELYLSGHAVDGTTGEQARISVYVN